MLSLWASTRGHYIVARVEKSTREPARRAQKERKDRKGNGRKPAVSPIFYSSSDKKVNPLTVVGHLDFDERIFSKKEKKKEEDEFPVQLCHKSLDDCGP